MGEPDQNRLNLLRRSFDHPLARRMFRNAAVLFSASGLAAVAGMMQGILIARMLGVEAFGVLGTITLFTGVVNNVASFRMDELVVKYVGYYTEKKDGRAPAVFKAAALTEIGSSLVAYALICLLSPLGAQLFAKDPAMQRWFVIYGAVVLFNLITESSTGLLQIFDRFKRLGGISAAQSLVMLALTGVIYAAVVLPPGTLPFRLPGEPLLLVILVYMVGKLIFAGGLAYLALREAARRWGAGWWRTPLVALRGQAGELVRFGVSTNLSATLNLVNKDSELLWVAYFRNPIEVGYYKLALSLVNLVQMPVNPLPNATYPEISRQAARRDWKGVRQILRQGSLAAGGYTLLVSLALLLIGQPMIAFFYTDAFLPAYPALLILLVGFLFANTFYWRRVILLALGNPQHLTQVNFLAALLKVGGYFLLIPAFGYLGCAGLLAGFYIFNCAANVTKALRTLHEREEQDALLVSA